VEKIDEAGKQKGDAEKQDIIICCMLTCVPGYQEEGDGDDD